MALPTREEIARELERIDVKDMGWTKAQFNIWWEKDSRNRDKATQYKRADAILKLIAKAAAK